MNIHIVTYFQVADLSILLQELKSRMHKVMKAVKEWGVSLIIAIAIVLFIFTFIAQPVKVPTGSMEPTVMTNDLLIMEKLSKWWRDYKFGDILVFYHNPDNMGGELYLKRLIGLPGDTIEVRNGVLYRNGERVEEPYLHGLVMNGSYGPVVVPEGHYFFMGDNRNRSHDARRWVNTFVPFDAVKGRAFFRYMPLNRFGFIK